jgi:L-Ala-D/L-Glu epimerase
MELEITEVQLDLSVPWKLSRNTSLMKTNFIITLREDHLEASSEVAPNIRYGETFELIREQFFIFQKSHLPYQEKLDQLPLKNSLRFALESAFIKLQSLKQNISLSEFLKLKPQSGIATSISVPIMEISEVASYLKKLERFMSIKIKVDAQCAVELVQEVARLYPDKKLRIDGNEAWSDLETYLNFEKTLAGLKIDFIEQPFPAARKDLYKELFLQTKYIIMADESIEETDNLEELLTMFHAVNIKLMKSGSLIKSRDFLIKAKSLGFKTMIGCMIESGLGISYALHLSGLVDFADLDGFLLIKKDPFQLVYEKEGRIYFS